MNIPSPFDLWILGRLLTGQPVDGELVRCGEPWKAMGERLADLPLTNRPDALDLMLISVPDRDELMLAMANIDPTKPAPEAAAVTSLALVMRRASEIQPLPVEWLWEPRLPLGMLSLFAGDPKLGKSFVTTALAASVSRGAPLPPDNRPTEPGSVIIMSAEDDPARTIVPRLKSAGADLRQIHTLEAVIFEDGTEALPRLRGDIDRIEQAASRIGDCRLIVVDPVSAYLGGIDDHKNAELRECFLPSSD